MSVRSEGDTDRSRFGRNFLHLALGTAFSRGIGFIRELATAAWVGGGPAMDRFVVAFTIPALFRRVFGEEMVERALLPPVKRAYSTGEIRRSWSIAWQFGLVFLATLLLIFAILWLNAGMFIRLIGPGILERDGIESLIPLVRLLLPFMIIIGAAAFTGGIILYGESVRIYSLAPAGLSIGVIAVLLIKGAASDARTLSIGFLAGAAIHLFILVGVIISPSYRRTHRLSWNLRPGPTVSEARSTGAQSVWVFFQSLAQKSVEIVDRRLASTLATGSVSALWYAIRLVQLPEAIIGLAAGRAGLAAMAEKHAKGHEQELSRLVHDIVERTTLVVVPITVFCCITSRDITSVVYKRGVFGEEQVTVAAWAFLFYSLGLPGLAYTSVLSRFHAVCSRNGFSLLVTGIISIMNIMLNYILVRTSLVHGGIALATSISFTVGAMALWWGFSHWVRYGDHVASIIRCFRIIITWAVIGVVLIPLHRWTTRFRIPEFSMLDLSSLVRLCFIAAIMVIIFRVLQRFSYGRW
jgi:putative peptidoglycan lipid II flippase